MFLVNQHGDPMLMATEDPLKSFVYLLHLVLIQNENLANGDEDGSL